MAEAPPLEWLDSKFKIERDSTKTIEGSGYLRLNTFWEAVSEQIDVEPNTEYTLSGLVNAFYLQHPQATSSARILIELLWVRPDGTPESVDINCPDEFDYSGYWQLCSGLQVAEGLDWQHVTKSFDSGLGTKLRIKLSNYVNNNPGCTADGANGRYDLNGNCELGGYSLFDDIQVKPVLEVQELDPEFITRSCRLYPAADAPACRYTDGDTLFYGQYGYCLTPDPNNQNQCLQWWPVDQIQGETFDDVIGGYADRIPLDYCVHESKKEIQISRSGTLARISPAAGRVVGQIIDDAGNSMNFIPFDIFDDYRPLARWPYMKKFVFNGFGVGVDVNYGIYIALPFAMTMYKDYYCYSPLNFGGRLSDLVGNLLPGYFGDKWWSRDDSDCGPGEGIRLPLGGGSLSEEEEWGGWAALPIAITLPLDVPISLVIIIPLRWELINSPIGELTSYASGFINEALYGVGGIGPPFGARIITDQDGSFGGISGDPLPDTEGDILGVAWFLKTVPDAAALALTGTFKGEMEIQYCDELVRVATSAGNNKSYANRVTTGSGYVLNENVDKDLDGDTNEVYENVNYLYYKPFNYRDFLYSAEQNGGNYFFYQSSDYQPFGALVPPSNAQYPTAWDSRQSVYRQPLFYEPPRTSAFDAPYQARMGELHSLDGLKNIFAKSYGIWHWEWIDDAKPKDGGQYKEGALISSGTTLWDLPTDAAPCPGNVRPTSGPLCLVAPSVSTIKVNDKASEQLKSNGLIKLSFNTKVDPDQLPIVSYKVDWGDGKKDIVSGVTLLNRTNPDNPFFLYHFYDFWEMQRAGVSCGPGSCSAQITITLKDIWNAEATVSTAPGAVTVVR